MKLSIKTLSEINTATKPPQEIFSLPEKVLQFGTGVLLRGLPDYFIDKANRNGIFKGRIVVVKSTDRGDASIFGKQDNLYTLCVRGTQKGQIVEENIICSAISRVIDANKNWNEILQCAHNPLLKIIISNTTEAGLQLKEESINQQPPESYPAKLLAFLYERYKAFNGSAESGTIIIPTELIEHNGKKLADMLNQLTEFNDLEKSFKNWLEKHNRFCNSLVDRIVPGKPAADKKILLESELGYTDQLLAVCEVYRLWAIEGDEQIRSALSFAEADEAVIIKPDIQIYKELKLRMLNATHTLCCGAGFLAGLETVKNAMKSISFNNFITTLMLEEIAPAIPYNLPENAAREYGLEVLDRFKNPFIEHEWINITLYYSTKMKMRVLPVLKRWYELYSGAPECIATGFAAFILFMKVIKKDDQKFYGAANNIEYVINDENAAFFYEVWKNNDINTIVKKVLQENRLWDFDLCMLNGFEKAVANNLQQFNNNGVSFQENLLN